MNVYLNRATDLKIKGLAYYQIIGGIVGLGSTVMIIIQPVSASELLMPILAIFATLFCFSIVSGQQLLKGNLNRGLKFSSVNQIFQIFSFAALGYSYKYVAGILFSIGIDLTNDFNFIFRFSISSFQFDINQETETLNFGFNLIAFVLVYYIDRLQRAPELKDLLIPASRV